MAECSEVLRRQGFGDRQTCALHGVYSGGHTCGLYAAQWFASAEDKAREVIASVLRPTAPRPIAVASTAGRRGGVATIYVDWPQFAPISPSACDWTEDFAHENGTYECSCVFCGLAFTGHKRRTVCKVCDVSIQEYERRFAERVQQHVTAEHTAVIAEREALRAELARLTTPLTQPPSEVTP